MLTCASLGIGCTSEWRTARSARWQTESTTIAPTSLILALAVLGAATEALAEPCVALEEAITMHRAAQAHAGTRDRATKARFREIARRYSTALSACRSIDRAETTYLRGDVYLFLLRDHRRAIEDYEAVVVLGGARRCEAAWNAIHAYTCLKIGRASCRE